jgi:hypothetical protein
LGSTRHLDLRTHSRIKGVEMRNPLSASVFPPITVRTTLLTSGQCVTYDKLSKMSAIIISMPSSPLILDTCGVYAAQDLLDFPK